MNGVTGTGKSLCDGVDSTSISVEIFMSGSGSLRREGFLFLADQLSLDFVNTCPVVDGQTVEFLPDWSSSLRWFRAAGLIKPEQVDELLQSWWKRPQAVAFPKKLRTFRETLRAAVLQLESGKRISPQFIEQLNELLAAHPMLVEVEQGASSLEGRRTFRLAEPEDLFAPLADSAAELLVNLDRSRVRMCDSCVLHFYDTTKNGTRRWCSMQVCGNRAKVASYAARQRKAAAAAAKR
jgi:predicted RNA-binding Zn ribbon-like protein